MTSCNRIFAISGAQLPVTMFSVSPKDDWKERIKGITSYSNDHIKGNKVKKERESLVRTLLPHSSLPSPTLVYLPHLNFSWFTSSHHSILIPSLLPPSLLPPPSSLLPPLSSLLPLSSSLFPPPSSLLPPLLWSDLCVCDQTYMICRSCTKAVPAGLVPDSPARFFSNAVFSVLMTMMFLLLSFFLFLGAMLLLSVTL